jgi:putative ABC transport system ATP-binding protein
LTALPLPGTDMAVFCRNISKSYTTATGDVPAIRGVDLDVLPGKVMFLVGPSGCGKTTLISIIAGVLHQDGGQCRVLGRDQEHLPGPGATAFRRRNIGFVFQAYNLISTLTAVENVAISMLLNGTDTRTAKRAALAALASVDLNAHADKRPAQLSGGQQQRVALARAIVHTPRLIVCDEPTSALDHRTGQEVMHLLRGLAQDRGCTLLVVTHDHRIYHFADCIAEMDDGRIERVTTPAELAGIIAAETLERHRP